jgi:hypothetical protein
MLVRNSIHSFFLNFISMGLSQSYYPYCKFFGLTLFDSIFFNIIFFIVPSSKIRLVGTWSSCFFFLFNLLSIILSHSHDSCSEFNGLTWLTRVFFILFLIECFLNPSSNVKLVWNWASWLFFYLLFL